MNVRILDDVAVSPNWARRDAKATCSTITTWRLSSGDLICSYRQGREKYTPDGVFLVQRSSDGGKSWSEPIAVFDGTKRAKSESVHAGVVCQLADGSVLAIYTTVESLKEGVFVFSEEGKKLSQHLYISRSSDGGISWTTPQEHHLVGAPRNAYIGSRPLVLGDGTLVLPVEGINEKGEEINYVSLSRDGGKSLPPLIKCAHDTEAGLVYGDIRLTSLPDGRILMLLWTWIYATEETQNVRRCVSADSGLTWSSPESTNARCQIMSPLYYKDDVVIAASNVRTPPAPGIHLWFSRNAGKEWNVDSPVLMWDAVEERMAGKIIRKSVSMDEAQEKIWKSLAGFTFGTPDLLLLGEDLFLLSYYARKDSVVHARVCRFQITGL